MAPVSSGKLPKVLIVEDSQREVDAYRKAFHGKVDVLVAHNIPFGRRLFDEHLDDLSLIVMDACVPGFDPNTIDLTRKFREHFPGPIIAASSEPDFRAVLMTAGCDHQAPKFQVPDLAFRLLGQPVTDPAAIPIEG